MDNMRRHEHAQAAPERRAGYGRLGPVSYQLGANVHSATPLSWRVASSCVRFCSMRMLAPTPDQRDGASPHRERCEQQRNWRCSRRAWTLSAATPHLHPARSPPCDAASRPSLQQIPPRTQQCYAFRQRAESQEEIIHAGPRRSISSKVVLTHKLLAQARVLRERDVGLTVSFKSLWRWMIMLSCSTLTASTLSLR